MNRRRFLAITAAMLATPGLASAATWRGRAFGGDVDITLRGARSAKAALPVIVSDIRRIERKFSLSTRKASSPASISAGRLRLTPTGAR